MSASFLEYIDAASTPLLMFLCGVIWRIKVNDLPHIHAAIEALRAGKQDKPNE